MAITRVPTTPGGGKKRKWIYVMGDPGHGFSPNDGTKDKGAMGSPDG